MRACLLAHRTAGSRAWLLRDGELLWFSVSCFDTDEDGELHTEEEEE